MTKKRWPDRFYAQPFSLDVPCNHCKHRYEDSLCCAAFPERIPFEKMRRALLKSSDYTLRCPSETDIKYEPIKPNKPNGY